MSQCDPLDPDSWPEGYICIQRQGEWILEEKADKKKGPHTPLIIGGLLGLAIGIVLAKKK